ncbi:MAG: hypothetical protein PX636_06590 [Microcystis sp. M53598_WE2]|nr:hypothetical protein [Microcystis sp. M53598_WE2]
MPLFILPSPHTLHPTPYTPLPTPHTPLPTPPLPSLQNFIVIGGLERAILGQ